MIGDNKSSESLTQNTTSSLVSYDKESIFFTINSKTSKLITALYMVTDIMDKDEPLRSKLRNIGTDILSDMHVVSYRTDIDLIKKNLSKIEELMSFLQVAAAIRMISEMNFNILKKEFLNLKDSLNQHNNPILLEDFLNTKNREDLSQNANSDSSDSSEYLQKTYSSSGADKNFEDNNNLGRNQIKNNRQNAGNSNSMRIGVQKGSTLLKAIKDIKNIKNLKDTKDISKKNSSVLAVSNRAGFDNLKKERREIIVKIIKDKKMATITDIKTFASGVLATCGEKTLQRELISMVNDGVLKKSGEKRWSRYFL